MTSASIERALLAVVLAVALPLTAAAQDAHGPDPHVPPGARAVNQAEVTTVVRELQQVHQELESLQQQALADPEINAVQLEIGEEIRLAMNEVDGTIDQQMTRIEELEVQANEAQQAGDQAELEELMTEAQAIHERFLDVQQQVLEQPQIAARITDFQTRLESKMSELNPEADNLIARYRELETKLADMIGVQPGQVQPE